MEAITSTSPYLPNDGRARAVKILLAVGMVFSFLSIVISLITNWELSTGAAPLIDTGGDADERLTLTAGELLELALGIPLILVFIATIVLFCMWIYRANKNLPALGNPRHAVKHPAGWAAGSFFVPFVNLIVPYQATKEIWAKSDPRVPGDNFFASQEPPAPASMKLWWAFWLISNFVNNISLRLYLRAETPEATIVATWFDIAGELLQIPAAYFAIRVVGEINDRQEERRRRVNFVANVPPPPPIFHQPLGGPPPASDAPR